MTTDAPSVDSIQARITRLKVQGFRSLRDLDIELPPLAVLIGANGAGKSNVIRFVELLSWMLRAQNLGEFVERQGGGDDQLFLGAKVTPRIDAHIDIDSGRGLNEYRFALAHTPAWDRLMFVQESFRYSRHGRGTEAHWIELDGGGTEARIVEVAQGTGYPSTQQRTARTLVHLLRSCGTYQFHDTSAQAPIKTPWDQTDVATLRAHGGNLAPILLHLRERHFKRYNLIERQIARVLTNFRGFELEPVAGRVQLRWRGARADKTFGAHLTSDGSLRLFCLIVLLNLPPEMLPDVILIDEPELGLHPAAISLVAQMVREVSRRRQVILSTQSPYLVDCFGLQDIVVADLEGDATRLRVLDPDDYRSWLEDDATTLADLWLRNVIGGRP